MRVIPQCLTDVPLEWTGFTGIISIDLNQLEALFPGLNVDAEITLRVPARPVLGHMKVSELGLLTSVIKHLGATSFAQIGTFDGLTVLNLLENCPDLDRIYTVDLPDSELAAKGANCRFRTDAINNSMMNTVRIGERFLNHPRAGIVTQIRKDSANLTPEDFGEKPEVFFVDGSHTYEQCVHDSTFAQQVLAKPGVIIWHDYSNVKYLPGVTQALLEIGRVNEPKMYWLNDTQVPTQLVFGLLSI